MEPRNKKVTGVAFKDEGDFGFITLLYDDDAPLSGSLGVPYDQNRERPYGTIEDAEALAREHGVEVFES